MRDHAGRIRNGLTSRATENVGADRRVRISLTDLRLMDTRARALSFLPRQPARSVLNGRHASRMRGRGLNFEELRDYLPGDDVRSIDWKVTARTGQPHVRVFTEERDRPSLIVVDQRMTMFFGTRLNMKSVTAAEIAALAAYRILDQSDRVGGVVFNDFDISEIRPQRSRRAVNAFLAAVAKANNQLHAKTLVEQPMGLNRPLEAVARIARRNHLVVIVSDFDGIDPRTKTLIGGLSRRNDVILAVITDPMAQEIPKNMRLVVSDGALQAEIDTGSAMVQGSLQAMSDDRLAEVHRWQLQYGMPILPISAGEDTLTQVRRLMGLKRRRA
ncbi:MAG: DUF58 domain-containing protein [Hyphomicrobiaceae bacterium]